MADKRRTRPYIWATWITKLIAGEDRCWYRAWYKAHHKYEKTPDDPDRAAFFADFTARHDAITTRRAEELRDANYVLKIEDQGAFTLSGKRADLAAKPDIVAIGDGEAIVTDAKAGKRRESDHWQVLIYIFGLGMTYLRGFQIRGEVSYQDDTVPVRALDDFTRDKIVAAINRVAEDIPPVASPSVSECRYCDVAACEFRKRDETGDASRYF